MPTLAHLASFRIGIIYAKGITPPMLDVPLRGMNQTPQDTFLKAASLNTYGAHLMVSVKGQLIDWDIHTPNPDPPPPLPERYPSFETEDHVMLRRFQTIFVMCLGGLNTLGERRYHYVGFGPRSLPAVIDVLQAGELPEGAFDPADLDVILEDVPECTFEVKEYMYMNWLFANDHIHLRLLDGNTPS